ncbi:MAG: type II toxin-antitoxin system VapC family toxin [Hyphomicrobiales bacterium]|nr:type II toxin-antitoxin system VapC family toxin [Hyphomicrobiales bacterium]MCP5372095.1 type II toxin-antitoxin system VapC family toxin [Hyphomicrobiales bacterium]
MTYLIDTNVISEVRKGRRCDARVAAWYDSLGDADLFLSVLVLGEIRRGVERIRRRDPAQARALEDWLAAVRAAFGDRVLPVDGAVAEEWGRMGAARPVSTVDGLLAATAKVHGLTLATRNTADVAGLGADVLNPFET